MFNDLLEKLFLRFIDDQNCADPFFFFPTLFVLININGDQHC